MRRLRAHDHDADERAGAAEQRAREHRLEAVLVDRRDEAEARVARRAVGDQDGLAVERAPAGDALAEPERELALEMLEALRRGAGDERLLVLVPEVDERVLAARRAPAERGDLAQEPRPLEGQVEERDHLAQGVGLDGARSRAHRGRR